jgi:hypothetical protein
VKLKILILIDAFFSKRDYDRFGLELMLQNDIEISCWDLYKLRPNPPHGNGIEKGVFSEKIKYHIFENLEELNNNSKLVGTFLIDLRSGFADTEHNTSWFKKKGAIIIFFEQGLIPQSHKLLSIFDYLVIFRNKLLDFPLKQSLLSICRSIIHNFITDLGSNSIADIKVCSGSLSKCNYGEFEIRSHARDYDIFLENNNEVKTQDQIIFVDSAMTGHPDDKNLNSNTACSEEVYFPLLRAFFDKIESQTGLPVVVSIHPRLIINDDVISNFGNRKIVSGKTFDLIKSATMVLVHNSTAINFAVLLGKPLIILTSNQIQRKYYLNMQSLFKVLNAPGININKSFDNMDFFEIAQKPISNYNYYIEKYIKVSGSPVQNSSEILIKGLRKYVQ